MKAEPKRTRWLVQWATTEQADDIQIPTVAAMIEAGWMIFGRFLLRPTMILMVREIELKQ